MTAVEGVCPLCHTAVRVVAMTAAGTRSQCDCGALTWTVNTSGLNPPRPDLKLVLPPDADR